MKKIVLLTFILLLLSTALVVEFIGSVKADWTWTDTICITADGSIIPDTAPISTVDKITYTLTDNIVGDVPEWSSAIVVDRDNIIVDGTGYTLQGTGTEDSEGIRLENRYNVTISNMEIRTFYLGIHLYRSSSNTISGNTIANNERLACIIDESSNNTIFRNRITNNTEHGICLDKSSDYNIISGNNITNNGYMGIYLGESSNCNVSRNKITNDGLFGIRMYSFSNSTISENNIANNWVGIEFYQSSNNIIYHNTFVNNTEHVHSYYSENVWDNGTEGNYWSDYEVRYPNAMEIDGIWDTAYVIDENNQDNYPLVPEFPTLTATLLVLIVLTVIIAIYKRRLLKTPIH